MIIYSYNKNNYLFVKQENNYLLINKNKELFVYKNTNKSYLFIEKIIYL